MRPEITLITEGSVLDDADNLITTTYIDLRDEGERSVIPALVKGCRREHALEDGETVLISKPARFREHGEGLIQDAHEGFAEEKSVTIVTDGTLADEARQRVVADLNEARELLGARVRAVYRETRTSTDTKAKSLRYGKDWWIFSTSIEPEDDGWDAWKQTLPDEYDHVSEIGQPAKFAQALAHMVAEQIGPQGKGGSLQQTTKGAERERTRHPLQWVIHGPVVYTDQVYQELSENSDGMARLAASIFTKSAEYADQREYRFAVLGEGSDAETVALRISGMMRDSLERRDGGFIRTPPPPREAVAGDDEPEPSSQAATTLTPVRKQSSTTRRLTEREERRWETRTPDGQLNSSDTERRERVVETIVTQKHPADDDEREIARPTDRESVAKVGREPDGACDTDGSDREPSDETAVQELAAEERDRNDDQPKDGDSTLVVQRGAGRAYRSFEDMLRDPAYPLSPMKEARRESALSPEEIASTYRAVDVLVWKLPEISEQFRQDIASAGWHAMHCIRNIYAELGDIVDTVWIERERFVVIRLNDSAGATGRIVVAPTGAYAYCLQLPGREVSGDGGREWGTMFFPMGSEVESFEEFGWPAKAREGR